MRKVADGTRLFLLLHHRLQREKSCSTVPGRSCRVSGQRKPRDAMPVSPSLVSVATPCPERVSPWSRGGHSNTCRRTVRDRGQDAVKRSTRVWNAGQRVNDQFQGRSNGQDDFTHYRISQRSTPLSRRYRLLLLVFISFSAATDYYTVTTTLRT